MSDDERPSGTCTPLVPSAWADAIREDINQTYPDLALGGPPPPPLPLRARLAYRLRLARERLGKRIAPTLLTDEEAEERYGDR